MKRYWTLTAVITSVLCLSGCGRDDTASQKSLDYRKEYRRGPLAVTVLVDHVSISLADEVLLRVETALDEGYQLQPIRFGDNLQGFGIRQYRTEPGRLDSDGRTIEAVWYRLEPFFTGELSLPEITIRFMAGQTAEDPGKEHALTTEAVEITVISLLEPDRENLALRPPRGVVELPVKASYLVLWAVGGAATVLLLLFYLRRRFRQRQKQAVIVPAHVKALARLRRLGEEKLLETGEIKTFFYLLSEILRRYVEDRFGLRAPEQTSEEFLRDLASSRELTGEHKDLMRAFLDHTDPVKYARLIPSPDEIQVVFDMTKQFILDTKSESATAGTAGKGGTANAVC